MLLDLKTEIIYGPVASRRLGRSLGVNVLPSGRNTCTFDCLYCQYGRFRAIEVEEAAEGARFDFPAVDEILGALEQALRTLDPPTSYITFSGNGEATLHAGFSELVEGVRELRDRLSPASKTAILSNSTTVNDPGVRRTLALLDVRIMKLDAGTEEMFAHYNRPPFSVTLNETVDGLAALEDVTIQSLFTKGPDGNSDPEHVSAWLEQVKTIAPVFVQVYTLDRASPTKSLLPMDNGELLHIKSLLERENIAAGVY